MNLICRGLSAFVSNRFRVSSGEVILYKNDRLFLPTKCALYLRSGRWADHSIASPWTFVLSVSIDLTPVCDSIVNSLQETHHLQGRWIRNDRKKEHPYTIHLFTHRLKHCRSSPSTRSTVFIRKTDVHNWVGLIKRNRNGITDHEVNFRKARTFFTRLYSLGCSISWKREVIIQIEFVFTLVCTIRWRVSSS